MTTVHKLCTSRIHRGRYSTRLDVSRTRSELRAHLSGMTPTPPADTGPEGIDRTVTLPELAALLGVTPQTIYDLRTSGRGPKGFRVGTHLRFRVAEVNAWYRRLEAATEPEHAADLARDSGPTGTAPSTGEPQSGGPSVGESYPRGGV